MSTYIVRKRYVWTDSKKKQIMSEKKDTSRGRDERKEKFTYMPLPYGEIYQQ